MSPLLGPPELLNPRPKHQPTSTSDVADPFIDLMVSNFNKTTIDPAPPMGHTENFSATYLSSGNPCLDLFFHVVPDTPAQDIHQRLQQAWDHNPLTTLKLICNLRGVRGTGKSDKDGFYTAALWLHGHHPKTLACNLEALAEFGYFKDFPEILYRLLEGSDVRYDQKREWRERGSGGKRNNRSDKSKKKCKSLVPKETRVLKATNTNLKVKEKASRDRKLKKQEMAAKVIKRYSHDPEFRFLYERVSDLFADFLKKDLESLKSENFNKITLAAKWCPSIDSSFDLATLICESIARKLFPIESSPEYQGIEEAHYAYRVRDRLRKEVLVPLRKILDLPEVYIGQNRWDLIPYNRVPSVAMNFYKEKFLKHDSERFSKFLEDVKDGKQKIAAGAVLPHEIIMNLEDEDGGQVAELQWKRMVSDLLEKGKLRNCIAVSDVSGSMAGTPMEVSIALGILISEVNDDPWKGKLITFSEDPKLEIVEGDDLRSKTEFVRNMDWGGNTDFQKVFDVILQVAVNGKLDPSSMVKRVFVFSDMEFDQASANPWETDYEVIVEKFEKKGYGDVVPQIVFWNLRNSKATPVPVTQEGVALVSGFSKNLIKIFLDNDGEINPVMVMESAISGQEYEKLVVID